MAAVQSIERAFLLLEAVATGSIGVTELAARVDLPKSTVARILKTLEQVGAVERVAADGRYRIGETVTGLAGTGQPAADLAARARPHLRMLAREIGEDAGLSVPDGYQVHYIAQESAGNDVQVRDWTGTLLPMHVVPSGLVMLAGWSADRLDRYLERPFEPYTARSVVEPDAIRSRLATIEERGHAWVVDEFVDGISSVAAPIVNGRKRVVGAVHVHGPTYRFPGEQDRDAVARLVMDAAAGLSE